MRLRFLSALPPLDRTSRLPLALTVLLLVSFVFQLLAANNVQLPEAGPVTSGLDRRPLVEDPRPATGGAVIVERSMFAPIAAPDKAGTSPLGGTIIAGSVQTGRLLFAIVQGPGDRIARVRVGGQVGDWRLRAIRERDVVLIRDQEQITVPFGARGVLPATAAATRNQQ